ncbi:MAG: twin-arginine translocase TatA/TatE family subunit [Isosphaeraceae bacterium]|nr:twin-arginine translocase TatA/TatE family subunit [Isosphaeraceae bacterium]
MFPNLNPLEMIVVFGVAVLLFGKKLPEVSRSLGRGLLEFKKSVKGLEEEFRSVSDTASRHMSSYTNLDYGAGSSYDSGYAVDAPKFQPPSASPVPRMDAEPDPIEE